VSTQVVYELGSHPAIQDLVCSEEALEEIRFVSEHIDNSERQ